MKIRSGKERKAVKVSGEWRMRINKLEKRMGKKAQFLRQG